MTRSTAGREGYNSILSYGVWILSHLGLLLAIVLVLASRPARSEAPQRLCHRCLVVHWNVSITPPGGAHLNWFDMKADPEDPHNLIVCGATWNAQADAYYGVVYVSHDGGRTWKTALEDQRSTWVTEQSCAFAQNHTAYFVSEAAKVVDGNLSFDKGTTLIFVSKDAGESWIPKAQTGWADYSQSVVTVPSGSDRPVLYVFYNDSAKGRGSVLGYFTVSRGGRRLSRRHRVPGMLREDYQGVYPSSSVVLGDGSLAVLYNAGMKSSNPHGKVYVTIGVAHLVPKRPPTWTTVATPVYSYKGLECPSSVSNSLAYDKTHDILYLAYDAVVSDHCDTMIATSRDGGLTWSRAHMLRGPRGYRGSKFFPILSVNKNGILGLLWRAKARYSPDCWYFSTSTDGVTLDNLVTLSRCVPDNSLTELSSSYLDNLIVHEKGEHSVSVTVMNNRDFLYRIGIAVTRDGVFHPVWSAMVHGIDQLRTARIRLPLALPTNTERPLPKLAFRNVTNKITVLYGGTQRLDTETNTITLDLSFRNNGPTPIAGPIYLQAGKIESAYGAARLLNSSDMPVTSADYVDASSSLRSGVLLPGETTSPYRLRFHFTSIRKAVRDEYLLLRFKLRIFCLNRLMQSH